ncbi:unnamed protein product [Protopolystoma xenopodis]|uniref:Uncharacterized protein n=1 Tax=Protopolystoma xenopodis TaxID=117903 RepID=A0A3S5CB16_9PLAT|nr:unnamed protein product [Protopolystoma xenopodis]
MPSPTCCAQAGSICPIVSVDDPLRPLPSPSTLSSSHILSGRCIAPKQIRPENVDRGPLFRDMERSGGGKLTDAARGNMGRI